MSAEVDKLEGALHELLALIDGAESQAVSAAWSRCQEAQLELNVYLAGAPSLTAVERSALRTGLERLAQLNAIAMQSAVCEKQAVSGKLSSVKKINEQMKAYAGRRASTGGTCDLAG
ncbi:MAG: hypothetical protein ACI8X5_003496 [Planctomycetota bacterium]|jgi:hypothetical protein